VTDYYFGSDTNTELATCGTADHRFYIGKIGGEVTANDTSFNSTTASETGSAKLVYSYWDIAGPSSSLRGGRSASAWGAAQASKFITTRNAKTVVGGTTLFGDLESRNGGWSDAADKKDDNHKLVNAFLAKLAISDTPGLYVNKTDWDNYLGSTWTAGTSFVWWLAAPASPTITNCSKAESGWSNEIAGGAYDRGGQKVMIWQYRFSPDFDITPYNGYLDGTWNPTPS
jgi:hypothetical protein